jgi:hypothetical protein
LVDVGMADPQDYRLYGTTLPGARIMKQTLISGKSSGDRQRFLNSWRWGPAV